ncbi:putative maltase MLT3 [Mariannaea sp. PMI_226]|nr:putative maltase MLT3 [Mariannaea sp. PMI_226]
MTVNSKPWWKSSIVYQIYPASFKDSNGDGVGDILGIISKLDYIASLGVDVIWICPVYDSPQVDMGYDISNYEDVYPPYGTLNDMERLIQECHARGLRIIMDLVINHTSNQHSWFLESQSSRTNSKRDWYIWRPARYDANGLRQPPNNWRAAFGGGSAWEWDPKTEEYYLHLFAAEQPDLNWENPKMRQALYSSAMEFWLSRGIDGFRIDTVNLYSKPDGLPDAPVIDTSEATQPAHYLYCNGPRIHEYIGEMNAIFRRYNAITVGELGFTTERETILRYISAEANQLNMIFQFDVLDLGLGVMHRFDTVPRNWTLPGFKAAVANTQALIRGTDGWTTVFMENHDQPRSVSRFTNDAPEHRVACAKLLALLQSTLSGTQFLYQGQEIGQVNVPLDSYSPETHYKDIHSIMYLEHVATKGNEEERLKAAYAALYDLARDHARVPMVWDGSEINGGFSDGKKEAMWMAPHPLAAEINVASQVNDKLSVLSFWKRALCFRREHVDLMVHGDFELLHADDTELFIFTKQDASGNVALVVLNFTDTPKDWSKFAARDLGPDRVREPAQKMVFSTIENSSEDMLAAFEGRVYFVQ